MVLPHKKIPLFLHFFKKKKIEGGNWDTVKGRGTRHRSQKMHCFWFVPIWNYVEVEIKRTIILKIYCWNLSITKSFSLNTWRNVSVCQNCFLVTLPWRPFGSWKSFPLKGIKQSQNLKSMHGTREISCSGEEKFGQKVLSRFRAKHQIEWSIWPLNNTVFSQISKTNGISQVSVTTNHKGSNPPLSSI